ncbi:type I methionyl aminopeptidase [Arthrobacter sp. StoSoilB5]|jgi:methionyl aminopeptidase|uniref:type I methionyl aminopeptidase n=1 Tax=Arthrobacter sp. StoSoilB5 TaxID=2830992 RepID=UPI001CC811F7|nr:type I methionyl aminopeptidase [Arthrobacter sp. StoSoilB5]BCW45891.1 methionine aminopeptidase [Arthrobacter sp. StoSoilB5]
MSMVKTPDQISMMREAGRVVAHALAAVKDHADVGISLKELDELAASVISDAGARPAFLNYHPRWAAVPFPGVICASVNDAVVHGIPDGYVLRDGDLLSVDCGAFLEGWCGDAAVSFIVGTADPVDQALIDATDAALARGIEAARVGNKMGDLAYAIGGEAKRAGYGLLADHGGHGIGRTMHAEPPVPNMGRPGRGIKLEEGLVIAIEPMLILGGKDDYYHDDDEWTLRSASGNKAAHSEHTVAITADGPMILTLP